MSNFALATLAIRLMGVYAWFQVATVATSIPYLFLYDSLREEERGKWAALVAIAFVMLAVWILLGFVLIFAAEKIARRLAPAEEGLPPPAADPGTLQAVLFSVVGLVMVAHALPALVQQLVSLSIMDSDSVRWVPSFVSTSIIALEFLMGVGLFVGSRGLSRLWRRIGQMNRMP